MDKNGIQISDPVCCKLSGYLEQSNEGYHIIGSLTRLHMIVYCIFSINIMKYLAFTWGIRKDLLKYLMILDCDVSSPAVYSRQVYYVYFIANPTVFVNCIDQYLVDWSWFHLYSHWLYSISSHIVLVDIRCCLINIVMSNIFVLILIPSLFSSSILRMLSWLWAYLVRILFHIEVLFNIVKLSDLLFLFISLILYSNGVITLSQILFDIFLWKYIFNIIQITHIEFVE